MIAVTGAFAAEAPIPPLPENVILQRDVEYGRAGERSLKLDLFLPKQPHETPLPVIVFIHGGGWAKRDKSDAQRHVPPYVASGNYIGASIGYRLTGEALWPAQLYDCKVAIRWLKANAKQYNIDPQRIGVWVLRRADNWPICWAPPAT